MQVSMETLTGLERKLIISVPTEQVENEIAQRIKKLAVNAKIDGFRPGKAPLQLIKKQYDHKIRQDVAQDLVQSTLFKAIDEQNLHLAGYPAINLDAITKDQPFTYTATFEVFPEITLVPLGSQAIEQVHATLDDKDVDDMLEKMREQHKVWTAVSRPVQSGDKVILDQTAFLNDEPFPEGNETDSEVILGNRSLLPEFEAGLLGAEQNKPVTIELAVPETANGAAAGKTVKLIINVKQVLEGHLPVLDDAFAALHFQIETGGIDALRESVKRTMLGLLSRRLKEMNREKICECLIENNPFDLPLALINEEINHLKHEFYHEVFGHEHHDNEKIPDFPRELFEAKAKRRVHLGLLLSHYAKIHAISADDARADALLEEQAALYEDPAAFREWTKGDKERMAELRASATEAMLFEHAIKDAAIIEKQMTYNDVVNPPKDAKPHEGE